LSSVTFESPSNLTDIPNRLFYYCSLLTSLCLPDSLIKIGASAFADTSLDSLTGRGVSKTDCFIVHLGTIVRCFGKPESLVSLPLFARLGNVPFPTSLPWWT
jgi:hypothetical protein